MCTRAEPEFQISETEVLNNTIITNFSRLARTQIKINTDFKFIFLIILAKFSSSAGVSFNVRGQTLPSPANDCVHVIYTIFSLPNTFLYACDFSIGSLGDGNSEAHVSDVTVNGAKISGTSNGVRIKTYQVKKNKW